MKTFKVKDNYYRLNRTYKYTIVDRLIKQFYVKTNIGTFECYLFKQFCGQHYTCKTFQSTVKFKGEEYACDITEREICFLVPKSMPFKPFSGELDFNFEEDRLVVQLEKKTFNIDNLKTYEIDFFISEVESYLKDKYNKIEYVNML